MSDLHQSARYADMLSRPPICSYCLANVVTIENGREHVLTCPSNPMVRRIAALESHVRALEEALADAMIRGVDDLASRGRWTALLDSDPSASPPTDKDPRAMTITPEQAPDLRALVDAFGEESLRLGSIRAGVSERVDVSTVARDTAKAALLAAIDIVLGRAAAPQAERVPCAGWVLRANGRWYLAAGDYEARAVPADATGDSRNLDAGPARWDVSIPEFGRRRILRTDEGEPDDLAPSPLTPPATLRLAQLAAEDAIAELCTAGLRAIGR